MNRARAALLALATMALLSPAFAEGDASRGQQGFRACAPCHSLEVDRNMTGPSLAGLWGRKAGSLPSFERYSDALKSSGIIWEDRSLDGWLTDPQRMVPDNVMPFDGIKDAQVRADLMAFLKEATKAGASVKMAEQRGRTGGMGGMMGGMMGGGRDANLRKLEPGQSQRDHLLPRHLSCRDRRRKDPRLLGAQSSLQDRFQRRGPGQGRARDHAGRDDGGPRLGDLRRPRRDRPVHRQALLGRSVRVAQSFAPYL